MRPMTGAEDDTALALVGEVITRWLEGARMTWNVPAKPSLSSRQHFSGPVPTPIEISADSYRGCNDCVEPFMQDGLHVN